MQLVQIQAAGFGKNRPVVSMVCPMSGFGRLFAVHYYGRKEASRELTAGARELRVVALFMGRSV